MSFRGTKLIKLKMCLIGIIAELYFILNISSTEGDIIFESTFLLLIFNIFSFFYE